MPPKVPRQQLDRVRLISCLGVDLELPHLHHFLDHYTALGIRPENIHVILNSSDASSPNLAKAQQLLAERGVADPEIWIATYTSDTMWAKRRELQEQVTQRDDWIINADIDEHHSYPEGLHRIIRHCENKGYNAIQGFLIDRLAPGGALVPVRDDTRIAEQYPLEAEVHLALVGRGEHHGIDGTTKLMLHRAGVFPSRGGHNPWAEGAAPRYLCGRRLATAPRATEPRFRFTFPFRVDHYKWTATRQQTFERRISTPGVSAAGREVGGKMTQYLARHGRIRLQDVSVRSPSDDRGWLGWKVQSLIMRLQARTGVGA